MVRISDILKKMKQYQGKPEEGPKTTPPQKPTPSGKEKSESEEIEEKREIPTKDHVTFIEAMKKGKEPERPDEAHIHEVVKKAIPEKGEGQNIYNDAVECCKRMATAYSEGTAEIEKDPIINIAGRIADYILFGGEELLGLVHAPYSDVENYRIYDLVDTGILTGHIGVCLGYNKSKLIEVIIVGLLHDVGMFKELDFVNQPRKLNADEWKELKSHPERYTAYLESLSAFSEEVIKGILNHHERVSGEGYPHGLSEDEINEYGHVVAVADAYEAMIHYRPHKNKVTPPNEVIKGIISLKEVLFNANVIKALIEAIGVYPVGSWVEINTGEICKVLSTNENLPLRPVIGVMFDRNKERFKKIHTIDLKSNPSLYIKRPVEENELKLQ